MSAEILRKAAAEIRERAEKATQGRWKLWGMQVLADQDGTSNVDTAVPVCTSLSVEHDRLRTFNAEHIASWHPAVALAVADLLDRCAEDEDTVQEIPEHVYLTAVKAARAYLGGVA